MDSEKKLKPTNEDDLTNIQLIVFEDEDGLDIEMEVIDEFELDAKKYIALRPSLDTLDFDAEDDAISFFELLPSQDSEEELFDLVEDEALIAKLADILESRLLSAD